MADEKHKKKEGKDLSKEEIEKLSPEDRIKVLKEIHSKKKKEQSELDALLNKSLREVSEKEKAIEKKRDEEVHEHFEDAPSGFRGLEEELGDATLREREAGVNFDSLTDFLSMYSSRVDYGELEGIRVPEYSITTGEYIAEQIGYMNQQVGYAVNNAARNHTAENEDQYNIAKAMQTSIDLSKQIFQNIAGEYMARFLDQRDNYMP